MGRIKGRKPEETRESVLEAATQTFAERGYANATLGLIAERAGVTAATLPYHFKNKEGLYAAVIEGVYGDLITLGRTLGARARFEDVVREVYAWAEDNRDGIRLILRAIIEQGGLDHSVRELRMGPTLDLISRLIAQRYGVAPQGAREGVVALTHLVMRFVTNRPEDNCIAFGITDPELCRRRIIDLLSRTGRHLMGLSEDA